MAVCSRPMQIVHVDVSHRFILKSHTVSFATVPRSTNMVSDVNSGQAKKEIISGFPCHCLSRESLLCYDSCYIFLFMVSVRVMIVLRVMVHVLCSAGRRGSCMHALRGRAPGAAGLLLLIEQGCATRGGWRATVTVVLWSESLCPPALSPFSITPLAH